MRHTLIAFAALAACAAPVPSPSAPVVAGGPTPHTRSKSDPVEVTNPAAALAALEGILTGRWTGEGLGGTLEETWNPRLAGRMLGTFRLVSDGAPVFSEHMVLHEEEGRVVLRLKHFGPDLVGWEERDESVAFTLVALEGSTAWFGGLTFHRAGDRLTIHLAMKGAAGTREEELVFDRAPMR